MRAICDVRLSVSDQPDSVSLSVSLVLSCFLFVAQLRSVALLEVRYRHCVRSCAMCIRPVLSGLQGAGCG